MAANTIFQLSKKSQASLLEFQKQCYNMLNTSWRLREAMTRIDKQYQREEDLTTENRRAKLLNRYGDSNRFQNITMPVILPAVEAAVVYQSSVFLSSTPIFEVVSSNEYIDAARQFSAVLAENSIRGGWIRELQMFLRDGFKYNLCAAEVGWKKCVVPSFETDLSYKNGMEARPKEIIWEGNSLKHLDMYNTFFDARVHPTEVSEYGEFAGYTEIMSRIRFKAFLAELGEDKIIENTIAALESGSSTIGASTSSAIGSYYIPQINSSAFINPESRLEMNWMAWAGMSAKSHHIQYQNMYEVATIYARLLPEDFEMRVPQAATPQIWKLIIINQKVVIYAERQTNAHNRIPILFGQPLEDGLGYQTKSLATNVEPIQSVTSALMNSVIHARRRSATDRGLYDPSRVSEHNINSDNPSAKIPVKPSAYGKPLNEAYYPIPFRDDQSSLIMQEIGAVAKLADVISGQNPARQGQFVKGNKTQTEYSDVMANSNGRDQTTSLLLEAQFFTPLKEIIKANTIQYQKKTTVYYRTEKKMVDIDPVVLRKAVMSFKISDGLNPVSKLINSDGFQTALQVIGSSPAIGGRYNVGKLFSYLMKTQGAEIDEFEKSEEQTAYEQAYNQWYQLATLAVQKGQSFTIPQPLPEQFGYLKEGELQQQKKPVENALENMLKTIASTPVPTGEESMTKTS